MMMKNRITILGLALFFGVFLTFHSCEFAKVEAPEIDPSVNIEFENTISGFVKSADSEDIILDAKVYIGDILIPLNGEGKFTYSSKDMEIGSYLTVSANGYVDSKIKISNQFENSLSFNYDFFLTKRNIVQAINANEGGLLQFEGGEAEIPANNSFEINNSPVEDIEISITPISKKTTYGKFNGGAPVQVFNFEPHGAVFEKPIVISFQADFVDDGSNLKFVVLNEETNIWEVQSNVVSFDPQTKLVSVEVSHFSGGGIINPNINISTDTIIEDVGKIETISNCDCPSIPKFNEYWYTFPIQISFGSQNQATWSELQNLGILSSLGIPYSQTLVNGQTGYGVVFFPLMGCTAVIIETLWEQREVIGTFSINNEVKTFDIKYSFGGSIDIESTDCPTWSGCHQGC